MAGCFPESESRIIAARERLHAAGIPARDFHPVDVLHLSGGDMPICIEVDDWGRPKAYIALGEPRETESYTTHTDHPSRRQVVAVEGTHRAPCDMRFIRCGRWPWPCRDGRPAIWPVVVLKGTRYTVSRPTIPTSAFAILQIHDD